MTAKMCAARRSLVHRRRHFRGIVASLSIVMMSMVLSILPNPVQAFTIRQTPTHQASYTTTCRLYGSSLNNADTNAATLTDSTIWSIRLILSPEFTNSIAKIQQLPPSSSSSSDSNVNSNSAVAVSSTSTTINLKVHFIEDEGYEPPQGRLRQVNDNNDTGSVKITKSFWKLSEDPNDRKDGLWVWGLFAEPLYPFLLLQFELDALPATLSDTSPSANSKNTKNDENINNIGSINDDTIKESSSTNSNVVMDTSIAPKLQFYAQINHRRDKKRGVLLEAGSDLITRQVENFKADPFGAARVDLYENVKVGSLTILPML